MKLLLGLLFLPLAAFGQIVNLDNGLISNYDKFKEVTIIGTDAVSLVSTRNPILYPDVKIRASCGLGGEFPDVPVFMISILSTAPDWRFLKYHSLVALADGSRFDIGKGSHSGDIRTGSRTVSVRETMIYMPIDKRTVTILANAENVEIQVGGLEAVLLDDIKRPMRELLTTCSK